MDYYEFHNADEERIGLPAAIEGSIASYLACSYLFQSLAPIAIASISQLTQYDGVTPYLKQE